MADSTKIEWTDATINAVNGCSVHSPGCTNCYAMRSGARGLPHHPSTGLTMPTKAGHVWTGEVRLNDRALLEPLRWRRPRKIFWNAHGDLFHENVPDEWIDRVLAVCALTPQHQHQLLTKRSARMRHYLTHIGNRDDLIAGEAHAISKFTSGHDRLDFMRRVREPLSNVWLGVSAEDQRRADERIPDLLATPAAVRFLSCEPLLGAIYPWHHMIAARAARLLGGVTDDVPGIDWVIAGGESGPGARPMHPDWARSLRDQCAAAGVPFHFKQWGNWRPLGWEHAGSKLLLTQTGLLVKKADADQHRDRPGQGLIEVERVGKTRAGRLLDGVEHNGFPQVAEAAHV